MQRLSSESWEGSLRTLRTWSTDALAGSASTTERDVIPTIIVVPAVRSMSAASSVADEDMSDTVRKPDTNGTIKLEAQKIAVSNPHSTATNTTREAESDQNDISGV